MAWLLLLWNCAFATTIELPDGEDPAVWVNPLALSGLGPETDRGAVVRFAASPAGWTLWVRDVDGAEHRIGVRPPTTRADREALAALAASLVHPVTVPSVALPALPPLPVPVVRRSAPAVVDVPPPVVEVLPVAVPVPVPVPASEPESVAVAVAVPAEPEPEPRPAPVVADVRVDRPVVEVVPDLEPNSEARTVTWWGGIGPSLRMRPSVRTTVAGGVWGGIAHGPWRIGAGLEVAAPATLLDVAAERRMAVGDLRAVAVWAPGRWELGPVGTLSLRTFTTGSIPYVVPAAGGIVARRVPLGVVALRIALLVERDLTPVNVWVGETAPVALVPLSGGLGISVWSR